MAATFHIGNNVKIWFRLNHVNGISTRLRLFNSQSLGNRILCLYLHRLYI